MSGYAVDMAELQQADGLLTQCAANARAALSGLTAAAHDVLRIGWSSPAAAAFRLGWEDWAGAAREALGALEELGRAVGLAGLGYDGTDTAVRTAVASAPS